MKDDSNSKLLLALLAGAAIGVVVGFFLNSEKKGEIIEDLKEGASKFKDNLAEEIEKGKTIIEDLINAEEEH